MMTSDRARTELAIVLLCNTSAGPLVTRKGRDEQFERTTPQAEGVVVHRGRCDDLPDCGKLVQHQRVLAWPRGSVVDGNLRMEGVW